MPDSTETKPVFIDQTPDYQQALQKIRELSKQPAAFEKAIGELGLTETWKTNKATIEALRPEADKLLTAEATAMDVHDKITKHHSRTGSIVGASSGIAVGVLSLKRFGVVKSALIAVATAFGAKFAYKAISPAEDPTSPEIEAVKEQKLQLAMKALELQNPFIETMATKMLSEQKELQGTGADLHLVSTKEPAQETSMAARYATAPAASNAAMVKEQKTNQAEQSR